MAGMFQKQALQNAHSTRYLSYGHLGTTRYDEDDQTWRTLRIIEPQVASTGRLDIGEEEDHSAFPFRHLYSKVVYEESSESQSVIEAHTGYTSCDDTDESEPNLDSKTTFNATTADESGLNDKRLAADALVIAEIQCPNCSELLAFGSAAFAAVEEVQDELDCIPIAASASGNNARGIRLTRIGQEIAEIQDVSRRDVSANLPYISSEDQAYWMGNGGPVQQVCFAAATGYSSTWMAVRLQSSTTIFHPLIHRKPVPQRYATSGPPFRVLPSSVLDANPLLTIHVSRTCGHPHADVAFHPQDYLKLALIDEHGNWSVWITARERQKRSRSQSRVTLLCSGKIWTWDHEKRLRTSPPYHDGWHRILWCSSSESASEKLFVCNRRTAAVYKILGSLLRLIDFQLGHARENHQILNVQSSKSVPGHYFVLTTTRLFWIDLGHKQYDDSGRDECKSHILLAWQHFRDCADRTLHLVLLETGMSRA